MENFIYKELLDSANKELENLICPISGFIMKNPVITGSGHTYDKDSIIQWFQNKNTDPLTNQIVNTKLLIPNYNLKSSINAFIDKVSVKKGDEWKNIQSICRIYKIEKEKEEENKKNKEKISNEMELKPIELIGERQTTEDRIREHRKQGRNQFDLTVFINANAPYDISYKTIKYILSELESKKKSSYEDAMNLLLYLYH